MFPPREKNDISVPCLPSSLVNKPASVLLRLLESLQGGKREKKIKRTIDLPVVTF